MSYNIVFNLILLLSFHYLQDPNMSVESKMEMRFLAEKLKTTNKVNMTYFLFSGRAVI